MGRRKLKDPLAIGDLNPAVPSPQGRQSVVIPVVIAVAFLMEQLDSTIVVTALPTMARSLHTTALNLNGVVTSYVLALAVGIPFSGWAAERFGAQRVFATAICIFTISSGLCGLATDVLSLEAMRALQGLGGALMVPVGRMILVRTFQKQDLAKAINYMSLPVLIGPAIGPILGGVIASYASWRWIFYINLPIGLAGLAATLTLLPAYPGRVGVRFDVFGFSLIGAALILLELVLERLGATGGAAVSALMAAGAASLIVLYVKYAQSHDAPALDLHVFSIRGFSVAAFAGGLSRIGLNAAPFLLPLLFQLGMGYSAVRSGLMTFASAIGAMSIKSANGWLLRRLGYDRLLVGNAILAAMWVAGFSLFTANSPPFLMFAYIFMFGAIRTVQLTATNGLAFAELPPDRVSGGVTLAAVMQQLTMSFGVSLSAAILALIVPLGRPFHIMDFRVAFLIMALMPLTSALGFLWLRPEDGADVSGHLRGAMRRKLLEDAHG